MNVHASVPTANFSNSKTPMGPFQITVLVVSNASLNVFTESGPISNPIQPSGILDDGTTCKTPDSFLSEKTNIRSGQPRKSIQQRPIKFA